MRSRLTVAEPVQEVEKVGRRTRPILVLLVLLAVGGAVVWQVLLNQQPMVPVAGRPLSSASTHLHTVAMSSRPGVIYLGTHFGLFASADNGHTWPQRQGELSASMVTSIAVSPTNADLLAVLTIPDGNPAGQEGIAVSADGGKHWQRTSPANLPTAAYPYSIQAASGVQGHFFVFFTEAGWFETHDLGRHWQAITSGTLATIQVPSLLVDPYHPAHLLMGGDQGLFTTDNDGQSWQQITEVQGMVVALSATWTPNGAATVVCATDHGLYSQRAQGAFIALNTLHTPSFATRVVFTPDGRALYAQVGPTLWLSLDQGQTWRQVWNFGRSDLVALVVDPTNSRELLAGFFWPSKVLISTDAGQSWQILTD